MACPTRLVRGRKRPLPCQTMQKVSKTLHELLRGIPDDFYRKTLKRYTRKDNIYPVRNPDQICLFIIDVEKKTLKMSKKFLTNVKKVVKIPSVFYILDLFDGRS